MNRVRLNAPGAPERIRPDGADFLAAPRASAARRFVDGAPRQAEDRDPVAAGRPARAAPLMRSYSSKRRASSARGSELPSSAAAFSLLIGNNRRDLISI